MTSACLARLLRKNGNFRNLAVSGESLRPLKSSCCRVASTAYTSGLEVLTFRGSASTGARTVASFHITQGGVPGIARRYGTALLSVLAALLLSHWSPVHLESAPVSLFLCAVMVSAWFGGVGPGLLATVLSAIAFYHEFLPPLHSFGSKPEQTPRFLAFIVSVLIVGSLSVAQRWAARSLRLARDNLSDTVQKLRKTNEALGRGEAYLGEAQTLSHTGSFGWNAATGELFWSDETFRIFGYERPFTPTVQRVLERVHPEDLRRVQEALDAASRGEQLDLEHRLIMPNGSVKSVHVLGHGVSKKPAGLVELVGAVTDITTVKNAFEEIRTLRDQLY